jgi:hypothetical protein
VRTDGVGSPEWAVAWFDTEVLGKCSTHVRPLPSTTSPRSLTRTMRGAHGCAPSQRAGVRHRSGRPDPRHQQGLRTVEDRVTSNTIGDVEFKRLGRPVPIIEITDLR